MSDHISRLTYNSHLFHDGISPHHTHTIWHHWVELIETIDQWFDTHTNHYRNIRFEIFVSHKHTFFGIGGDESVVSGLFDGIDLKTKANKIYQSTFDRNSFVKQLLSNSKTRNSMQRNTHTKRNNHTVHHKNVFPDSFFSHRDWPNHKLLSKQS